MMKNIQFRALFILALAVFLLQSLPAGASAAKGLDPGTLTNNRCDVLLANASERLAKIDIPAHRADYAAFDQIADCILIAGKSAVIPSTGRASSAYERYMQMKEQQADRMSR